MKPLLLLFALIFSNHLIAQELNEKFVKVRVYGDYKNFTENQLIGFRIREELPLNNVTIKATTLFYAAAHFEGGRVHLKIDKIKVGDKIYPVTLEAYDADLNEGLVFDVKKNKKTLLDGWDVNFRISE